MREAPRKPSETVAGERLLDQLSVSDRHLGSLLLDSLKLVDEGRFLSGLRSAIEWRLEQLDGQPVALIPIGEEPVQGSSPDTYSHIDSRYIVATVCRELRLSRREIVDGWDIELMRGTKVRHLVFVDDLVGSGESLRRETSKWLRHPSIRSWVSYGLCDVSAVSYAATSAGTHAAEFAGLPLLSYDGSCDLVAASLRNPEIEIVAARRLLMKYGTSLSRGFGNAEAMLLIQHTVPNSLPSLFWQKTGKDGRRWPAIFDRHTYRYGDDVEDLIPYEPASRIQDLLTQHAPLVSAGWIARQPHERLETLLVATLLARDKRTPFEIAQITGLPKARVAALIRTSEAMGLLDARRLRRELRSTEVPAPWRPTSAPSRSNSYFPRFIRPAG